MADFERFVIVWYFCNSDGVDGYKQKPVQVSREESLVIALDSCSLTKDEIDHWDVELDRERKTLVYEV